MKPLVATLLSLFLAGMAVAQSLPETSVGMPRRINDVLIPGPKLEPKPIENSKVPIVLRLLQARSEQGGYRYEFEFFALEPGQHDLARYLRRADGSPTAELPPILVQVNPVLPAGQVEPNKLQIERGPWLGGYRLLLIIGSGVWLVGLVVIIVSFFFPRTKRDTLAAIGGPLSVADKLRPLVEGAVAGKLSQSELSLLERNLLALWRKKLHLENTPPDEAIESMRLHPEAGPLLKQLEDWLHNPKPATTVNVESLLKPYAAMAADALPGT